LPIENRQTLTKPLMYICKYVHVQMDMCVWDALEAYVQTKT